MCGALLATCYNFDTQARARADVEFTNFFRKNYATDLCPCGPSVPRRPLQCVKLSPQTGNSFLPAAELPAGPSCAPYVSLLISVVRVPRVGER